MGFRRVVVVVLDSVGVGALPDAADYGDAGAHTLGHVAAALPGFRLPHFEALGLGGTADVPQVPCAARAGAHFGRMALASPGKDTVTGHWEIGGVVLDEPFSVWPRGFSDEILDAFTRQTGFGVLGNKAASGTTILDELGAEHLATGKLIVYTSADSVFQVAAHEERVPLERLYGACEAARRLLDPYRVARVIARPFVGQPGAFQRTYNRHDYAMLPPHATLLDDLTAAGVPVVGIGKIKNIFADRGVGESIHTAGNTEGLRVLKDVLARGGEGFVFANLVDFDMLYGHRNDAQGYARALIEVDEALPGLLDAAGDDTLLVFTADHGCDPTQTWHTDHTREYVPLLAWHAGIAAGRDLGTRPTLADLGQTVADNFGLTLRKGTSFLGEM